MLVNGLRVIKCDSKSLAAKEIESNRRFVITVLADGLAQPGSTTTSYTH